MQEFFCIFAYFCICFQTMELNFALEMFYYRGYALCLSLFLALSLSLSNINTYSGSVKFSQGARMKCVLCSMSWNDRTAPKSQSRDQSEEEKRGELVREAQHRRESWKKLVRTSQDKDVFNLSRQRSVTCAIFLQMHRTFTLITGVTGDNLTNNTFAHKCLIQEVGGIQGDPVSTLIKAICSHCKLY